jgi:hypothetical protein
MLDGLSVARHLDLSRGKGTGVQRGQGGPAKEQDEEETDDDDMSKTTEETACRTGGNDSDDASAPGER